MIDLKNLETLMDPELKLGETSFRINKMPAMKGWRVLLGIRKAVGDEMRPEELSPDLLRIAMALPTPYVLQLQDEMFAYVDFWNDKTTPQKVKDAEDMAFDGLEPGAVMEVLVRSLCVNFSPSFRGIIEQISRALAGKPGTSRKSPKGSTRTSQRR